MNETVRFGRWTVRSDRAATRKAYALLIADASRTELTANYANFVMARDRGIVYPSMALDLFERLGINPDAQVEVSHFGRLESGLHLYGGWFHFVGVIVGGVDAKDLVAAQAWQLRLEPASKQLALGFTEQADLIPSPFAGHPVVQLEFEAKVPWIIDSPEPD